MADISTSALYGSVVDDAGQLFVGVAEGEDEKEGYGLFRQLVAGGPLWFEVNDEGFGAQDVVEAVTQGPKGIAITP